MPFVLKPAVEAELNKIAEQRSLEATDYMVIIAVQLTNILKNNSYPLPIITEMIILLTPTAVLSKLDLSQAYQQHPVDEETA